MIHDKKKEEPVEEEITLADIVENEEDKKILEPVVEEKVAPKKNDSKYIMGFAIKDGVFVRQEPEGYSEILYILKQGEPVLINHDKDTTEYYYMSIKSVLGYVLKDEITFG